MLQSENEENMYLQNTLKQVKDTMEKLKEAKHNIMKSNTEKNYQEAKAVYFERINQYLLKEIQGVQNLKTLQESEHANTTKDFVFFLTNLLQQNEKLYKENQELKISSKIDQIQKKDVQSNNQTLPVILDANFQNEQINTLKQIYEKKITIQNEALANAMNLIKDQQNFYQDQILFFFEQFSQAHSLDFSIQLENMRQRFGIGKLEQRDLNQLEKDKIVLQNYSKELQEENALIITNYNELVREIRELKQQHQFRLNHRLYPVEFIKKNKEILKQKDLEEYEQNLAVYKKQQEIQPVSSTGKKFKGDFSVSLYEQDLNNFYKRQTQFYDKKIQIFKQQKLAQEAVCKQVISKLVQCQQQVFKHQNENVQMKQIIKEQGQELKITKENFDNLQTIIFNYFDAVKKSIVSLTDTNIEQYKIFQQNVQNVMQQINQNYKECNIDLNEFMVQFSSLNIQIYQDLSQKNLQLTQNNNFLEKTNDKLINQLLEIEKSGNQEVLNQQIENFKDDLNTETKKFETKIDQIDKFIQEKKQSLQNRQEIDNNKILQDLKQDLEQQYNKKTNKYKNIVTQMKQKLQDSVDQYEKRIQNVKQKVKLEANNLSKEKSEIQKEKQNLVDTLNAFNEFKKKFLLKLQDYSNIQDENIQNILEQIYSNLQFDGSLKDCIVVSKVFTQNIKGFVSKMETLGSQVESQCEDPDIIQEYGRKVQTYSKRLSQYINDLSEKFEKGNLNLKEQSQIQLQQKEQQGQEQQQMQIEEPLEQKENIQTENQEDEHKSIDYDQFDLNKEKSFEEENMGMDIEEQQAEQDQSQNFEEEQNENNKKDVYSEKEQSKDKNLEDQGNNISQQVSEEQVLQDQDQPSQKQSSKNSEQNLVDEQENIKKKSLEKNTTEQDNGETSQNMNVQQNEDQDPDYQPTEEEILQWKREQAYFQKNAKRDDSDYEPTEQELQKWEKQHPEGENKDESIAQHVVQLHQQEAIEQLSQQKSKEEEQGQDKPQQGKKLTALQKKIQAMKNKNNNKQ